jgi:uncharacterized protein (TIGR03435 family)
MRIALATKFAILLGGLVPGEQQSVAQPARAFEVASIKQAPTGPNGVRGGCHGNNSIYTPAQQASAPPLGRCVITDARLSHLIGIAYGISMVNLKTVPDWIQRGELRFNVEAKAEDPPHTSEQQLLVMLQNLLIERFQLKFHNEPTEIAGFALTVAKNGPKLKASQSEDSTVIFKGPNGEQIKPPPGQAAMTARKYTIPQLINILTLTGNGPGLDKTGLTGEYDFTLSWDENAGPDISTALREQLGLRMEPAKVPSSTFVVDSATKPTAN